MEWSEYISYLLASGKDFENLSISLDEGHTITEIPPIIQTSIIMLDKMIEKQGHLNVMVFPEKVQSIFIFTLMKLFHNISSGKIKSKYDPAGFTPGEKLKVGNAIVEYLGMREIDGKPYLSIRLADVDSCTAPLSYCPVFQRVTTKRRLSKRVQYVAARKAAVAAMSGMSSGEGQLAYVADMKTHMDSSIFTMTSVAGVKEQLRKCRIDGEKVTDVFFIGQVDYEGKISNVSPGQMSGTPAIVFASDLYAISAASEKNNQIQSIIIDGSNGNTLQDQLDALDELIELNIPIVCITDVANSFELDPLMARGFNVWRWDKDSITSQLYDAVPLSSDKKIKNCAKQTITYLKADGDEISTAMKLLASHRRETEAQPPQMMKLFECLNNLTFSALRTTIPLSAIDADMADKALNECQDILAKEKMYLPETTVVDYETTIEALRNVYSYGYEFKKEKMLQDFLLRHRTPKVILIIPERSSKQQTQKYWSSWCLRNGFKGYVQVLFPAEYYAWSAGEADITVICGWLKRAVMRKIIYGYNTSAYVVLLYDYENRWKNHDSSRWTKALDNSGNKRIIEKSFATDKISVSTVRYEKSIPTQEPEKLQDELGEIELILRENKYRQYINSGARSGNDTVSAIPVNFVGGYLAFYRTGHKVVSVTQIILSDADKIETKIPSELKVGDFIVVRESDKDIVREIADVALENSGKGHLRALASKWREALEIELLFCSVDEFCEKVQAAGCDKGIPTIKRWIEDEDVIAPRSRKDLQILAEVTENELLLELLDPVFEAAREVRNAHVLAGRKLSEQLKLTLAKELKQYEDIDPFNFWEPIEMDIEGIGNVKVLKIIDIGTEMQIDSADTNRLIEE
ncbi:MAG: DrmE family protein [Lachnospiraceae bacterium]|nr:DrmE family protein [Lachnospiraceae bacterium]